MVGSETPPGRRLLAWAAVGALVVAAAVGSNVGSLRDRLLGSAVPASAPAAASRTTGAAGGSLGEPTRLRSAPWWQAITTLEGSGPTPPSPIAVDPSAIQWRATPSCGSGRITVRVAQEPKPLIDASCSDEPVGFSSRSGLSTLEVTADGPWRLDVAQRIERPLVEPPLTAMTAPGTMTVATGSLHRIERTGSGQVTIYSQADGRYSVRLDDFFVSPNTHLQLRLSTVEAGHSSADYRNARSQLLTQIDVTAGSVNFTAPVGVDPTDFRSVVIWCPPVDTVYAAATLRMT